jgi:hypothetical protein
MKYNYQSLSRNNLGFNTNQKKEKRRLFIFFPNKQPIKAEDEGGKKTFLIFYILGIIILAGTC